MFYFPDSALMVNILMVSLLVVGHENIFKDSTVIHKFVFLGADPCFIGLICSQLSPLLRGQTGQLRSEGGASRLPESRFSRAPQPINHFLPHCLGGEMGGGSLGGEDGRLEGISVWDPGLLFTVGGGRDD